MNSPWRIAPVHTTITPYYVPLVTPLLTIAHPQRWRVRTARWDGYYRLLTAKRTFPTGLLPFILRKLEPRNISLVWDTTFRVPNLAQAQPQPVIGPPLYPHQRDALEAIIFNRLRNGIQFPRGVIEVGTAGGKTLILAHTIAHIPGRSLVVVKHKYLLHQIAKVLHGALGEPIGIFGDGSAQFHRITVATVNTLNNYLNADLKQWLASMDGFFVDECHRASAREYKTIAMHCHAPVRIGFSGTPFKAGDYLHKQTVRGIFGDVLIKREAKYLIAEDVVAPVEVYFVPVHPTDRTLSKLPFQRGATDDAYAALIVNNAIRNKAICEFARSRQRPTLILVEILEHGTLLAEQLQCPFLSGKDPTTKRFAAMQALANGDIPTIIATTIFDEGVDLPAIKYIVLAGGLKSPGRFKQRIGRGMRRTADRAPVRVLDFLDATHPQLKKHSKIRLVTAHKTGYTIIPWEQPIHDIP